LALVPFKNAEDIGDRFLELLADLGSDVSTATQPEDNFLSGTAAVEAWRSPITLAEASDTQRILQAAAGLHGLAEKVLAAAQLPDFQPFRDHLRLRRVGQGPAQFPCRRLLSLAAPACECRRRSPR
jgi:uncharacterized protein (DUF2342 family)